MYCEKDLKNKMNSVKPRLSREFKRIESWYKLFEPDIEFYIYENWNINNPKQTFYVCDILNDEKRLHTVNEKTLPGLYNHLIKLKQKVKSMMK